MIATQTMKEIADYLLDTCHSVDEAATIFGVVSDDILEQIEEYEVERCTQCDWWFEISELNEGCICSDCQEEG